MSRFGNLLYRGAMAFGYDAGQSSRQRKDLGFRRSIPMDEDATLAAGHGENIRLKLSDLYRNDPIVAGACRRIGVFGGPMLPQARTRDPGWNRAAEQWWGEEFERDCDARRNGPVGRSSLTDFQRHALSLRPTHGGLYFEWLKNGRIRPIEAERIRQPTNPQAAKLCRDGVRVDRTTGDVLGYWVHSRDEYGMFGAKHVERFVDAASMFAVISPPWRPDQVREVPDFAAMETSLQDVKEMSDYARGSAKEQQKTIATLNVEGGAAGGPRIGARTNTTTVDQRETFRTEWGSVLKLNPRESLNFKETRAPGNLHVPYMNAVLRWVSAGSGFPYEFFTLDFTTADFSRMTAVWLMVNKVLSSDHQPWLVNRFLRPLWERRVALAMAPGGPLSPAPTNELGQSEWARVDWQAPEELTVDRQKAAQSDMLEIQMGKGTLTRAVKKTGRDLEDSLRERGRELQLIDRIATEYDVDPAQLSKMQIPGQTEAKSGGGKEPTPPKSSVEPDEDEDKDEDVDDDGGLDKWLT